VISPLLANIYLHYFGLASSLEEKRSPQDQEFPSPGSKAVIAIDNDCDLLEVACHRLIETGVIP
jgi:hypothetical protein